LFFAFHGDITNTQSLYIYVSMFGLYMIFAYYLKKRVYSEREKKKLSENHSFTSDISSPTKKVLRDL